MIAVARAEGRGGRRRGPVAVRRPPPPRSWPRRTQAFDLVTIGNAFHRLRRDAGRGRGPALAASRAGTWRCCGAAPRPTATRRGSSALRRDDAALAGADRARQTAIPAGLRGASGRARPDLEILRAAGFEIVGRLRVRRQRTGGRADEIAGFVASTSVLSPVSARRARGSLRRRPAPRAAGQPSPAASSVRTRPSPTTWPAATARPASVPLGQLRGPRPGPTGWPRAARSRRTRP